MPGEAKALLAAALWAIAGIVYAAQMRRFSALRLNLIRSVAAAVFICLLIPFAGAAGELRTVSTATVIAMVGSGILAIGLGDSLFFASLPVLGASLAVPRVEQCLSAAHVSGRWVWLDETITVDGPRRKPAHHGGDLPAALAGDAGRSAADTTLARRSRLDRRGAVLLLMIATVFWTLSTTWLRAGSGDLGPVSAGALRAGGTTLFLLPATLRMREESPTAPPFAWGSAAWVAAAGILAVGIGSLFYIAAVQEAGAGRTAILTSTMPLFTLPLAVLFLRERVTPRIVAGTITCVAGIWLIV